MTAAPAAMLIDTHCHLDCAPLSAGLPDILASAADCGVLRFIVPGIEPHNWQRIMALAGEDPRIAAAPGLHPMHADQWNQDSADLLRTLIPAAAAVGEIGLDYSDGMPARQLQQEAFRAQLQIAASAALPVIIHCRQAFADTLSILAEERVRQCGGVMHAFSGSVETARACIAMGLKIGIAGPVTWQNAVRPVKIVAEIPLHDLLLETDSPDLPPEPHRGEINTPAFLPDIARKVAAIKSIPLAQVAAVTSASAEALFFAGRATKPAC